MLTTSTLLHDPGPMITLRPGAFPSRGVRWGHPWQIGTPSYWVELTARKGRHKMRADYRIGRTLTEEVVACLLGGHGIPHEMGLAAFGRLRDEGLLTWAPPARLVESCLRDPLQVNGRTARYRFPAQKARFVAAALETLHRQSPPTEPLELRRWLMRLPGVGPKTSGWIVRNHSDCSRVAIIDVHVFRAGVEAGIFDPQWSPTRNYEQMEALFICWAEAGGVPGADLDAVIWSERAHAPLAYARRAHLE